MLTDLSQPEVEDTADLYISTAKNSSMTGQAVQIGMYHALLTYMAKTDLFPDSGFSFK
jgi:hypothetical protein